MSAALLSTLREHGVSVWAERGQLRYRAPTRKLTAELREQMRQNKDVLLRLLQKPAEDEHGPVDPCPACRCYSFYRKPRGIEWHCRDCRPVELAEGYTIMIVPHE